MKFKYIKKSYKYIGLLALMLMGQSCSDLLEEEVISSIGNDYINTPKGFEDAAKSAYSSLRNYYGTQQGITITEFGTDLTQQALMADTKVSTFTMPSCSQPWIIWQRSGTRLTAGSTYVTP